MRDLIHPHCERCDCSLVILEGEKRSRTLCVRCHEQMATASQRNKDACRCGAIDSCRTCRQREYKFAYTRRNRRQIREYWTNYYWDHYAEMRVKINERRRAKKGQCNDVKDREATVALARLP